MFILSTYNNRLTSKVNPNSKQRPCPKLASSVYIDVIYHIETDSN